MTLVTVVRLGHKVLIFGDLYQKFYTVSDLIFRHFLGAATRVKNRSVQDVCGEVRKLQSSKPLTANMSPNFQDTH